MTKILPLPHTDLETTVSLPLGGVLNVQFPEEPAGLWYPASFDKAVLRRNGYSHFTDQPGLREDAFKGVAEGVTVIEYERPSANDPTAEPERRTLRVTVA